MNCTWENSDLADVHNNGPGYMYSLICDYERYVFDFGYMPVCLFIEGWKCITWETFNQLIPGDYVYTPQGVRYLVMETPYESDDEMYLYVEATKERDDGSFDLSGRSNETLQTGDLYSENVIHEDYHTKKAKLKESEEKICTILITKTNQAQS